MLYKLIIEYSIKKWMRFFFHVTIFLPRIFFWKLVCIAHFWNRFIDCIYFSVHRLKIVLCSMHRLTTNFLYYSDWDVCWLTTLSHNIARTDKLTELKWPLAWWSTRLLVLYFPPDSLDRFSPRSLGLIRTSS